ncbi:MAG TPA: aminoacetone oxidase family FAD-binding enzyme [Gemmatimonadales bacterium]|nr:aminoacetone oxidase family FAD-binding enzyme [Gemmatimonadales bacterium]
MTDNPDNPIVVVGAGAAGLLAAIFAARAAAPRRRRVLLLERTADGGRKILISGGGRCNVLPSALDESRYVTASSPNTLRKLLRMWPLPEQIRFFEAEVGLRLVREAETGKLFPEGNRAREVRDRLVALAKRAGATFRGDALVEDVIPGGRDWHVVLRTGETLPAAAVILATGGLSVPATGSDGTGLAIARRLGHTVHDTYPALTPLTAEPPPYGHLAGISPVVTLEAPPLAGMPGGGKRAFRTTGGFLFTHRGYSGPAVLDVSHLAVRSRLAGGPRQPIHVQWTALDAAEWERLLTAGGQGTVANVVRRQLPARLADALLAEAGVDDAVTLAHLPRERRRALVEALTRHPLPWTGDEGYKKAEVTGGGVALGEIDPRTMESRLHPGLYLCGEILDAFGPIGGYNFFFAWATGRAAGIGAGKEGGTAGGLDVK